MKAATVTRKGQVTIPKTIRERLGVKDGEKIVFVLRGDEVVLKVLRGNILELRGSVKPRSRPQDFEAIRRSVRRAMARKIAKDE